MESLLLPSHGELPLVQQAGHVPGRGEEEDDQHDINRDDDNSDDDAYYSYCG